MPRPPSREDIYMPILDQYTPDPDRYDGRMPQRRCGDSGITLAPGLLGFWHNFGDTTPLATQRAIMRAAFDVGVTHFDLANNYGPPVRQCRDQRRADPARGLRVGPRRADHLHEGGLGHVAGTVRRSWGAQVPAGQPGRQPGAPGAGLRRHLLQPPRRSGHPARGDDGRAGHCGPAGQGAVRRDLVVLPAAHRAERRRCWPTWAFRC